MNIAGKIIFISNRNVRPGRNGLDLFGEDLNELGADELNLATAEYLQEAKRWKFELLTDPSGGDPENPVSRQVFEQIMESAEQDESQRRWVLFVHGYNQSIEKNLIKCREIASHGVNVIIFSWPSNPGPQRRWLKLHEYRRARKNARRSALALERALEKVCGYIEELSVEERRIGITLAVHSLGNYLLENYVRSNELSRETRVFDTILLNQADADNNRHAKWVQRLAQDSRVYVTINEPDRTLAFSQVINGDRLGNTVRRLKAADVNYMDFTNGKGVGRSHRPWNEPGRENPAVHAFFRAVFHGKRGEHVQGWQFDRRDNAFRLVEREESQEENLFLDT